MVVTEHARDLPFAVFQQQGVREARFSLQGFRLALLRVIEVVLAGYDRAVQLAIAAQRIEFHGARDLGTPQAPVAASANILGSRFSKACPAAHETPNVVIELEVFRVHARLLLHFAGVERLPVFAVELANTGFPVVVGHLGKSSARRQ